MNLLNRYITSIFIRHFLVILVALIGLYGLIDFLEKVDDFIEHGARLSHYLLFPLYNLPLILSNTLPMAILLGAFATIGSLSKTSQLTALSGGGISFVQISRPLFLCGLVLSGVALLSNAWLLPLANREAHYLITTELKGTETLETSSKNIYLRGDDFILNIDDAFPERGEVTGLSLLLFDADFQLLERFEAVHGQYKDNGDWTLKDVRHWQFSPETRQVTSFEKQEAMIASLKRTPSDLVELWSNPEEMTLTELFRHIGKRTREGHPADAHRIEAQVRLAKSATPLIMILLGIPFALQRGRQANFSLGFIISLLIFMGYFLLHATFTAFAYAAILPPWIAAWSANILLALVGAWLFLRIQN